MPCTIIAEAGVNHDGDFHKAIALCDAAKESGADIVKFQTYVPEKSIRRDSKDYALLSSLALSFENTWKLARYCAEIGIEFCSTPDDLDSLEFLVKQCGVKRLKIGSGSLTYKPLLAAAFKSGVDEVLVSTGMATLDEVGAAIDLWHYVHGGANLVLMHCVSLYPCPLALANVATITTLRKNFCTDVGYSDHTVNSVAAMAAVALGATVIEKHFTLDMSGDGPDHHMSMNPAMFANFVKALRLTESAIGDGLKQPGPDELAMIPRIRKDENGLQPGL